MRIPNPRLIRIGGLTRGAIIESGDGELILTPVIQPIIELASPINVVQVAITGIFDDSFLRHDRLNATGAGIAASTTMAALAKGVWIIEAGLDFGFTGTTNVANFSSFSITDPDANQCDLFEFPNLNGYNISLLHRFELNLVRDNFVLAINRAVTVGGDALSLHASVNAKRIL
jgi:hypothetical protein